MIGISHKACPAHLPLPSFLAACRELGFETAEHLAGPAGSPPIPDAQGYRALDLRPVALRAAFDEPEIAADPGSARARAALSRARFLAALAREVGCPRVLVECGRVAFEGDADLAARTAAGDAAAREELRRRREAQRDRRLDAVCRNLHELLAREPELLFALVPSPSPLGVPAGDELPLVFAELKNPRLGYWHAPDACALLEALGLGPAARWLEAGRRRLCGSYLADHTDGKLEQLPGTGTVDWKALAGWLVPGDPVVLRVAPGPTGQELKATRQLLAELGWK